MLSLGPALGNREVHGSSVSGLGQAGDPRSSCESGGTLLRLVQIEAGHSALYRKRVDVARRLRSKGTSFHPWNLLPHIALSSLPPHTILKIKIN